MRKILWSEVTSYMLTSAGQTKKCSRVIEPTKDCPNYFLMPEGESAMHQTGPSWGRLGGEEHGVDLWFYPLDDARVREANAKFEELVRSRRRR